MPFDIIPRSLLRLPSLWEDDDNFGLNTWGPTTGVSVSEDDKHVYVSAHVPGIKEDDIDITFDKGMLWIKGESRDEEKDTKKKYYRKAVSSFSYRVAVPGEIDLSAEPEADYKNGVMQITFKKSPHAQPKKISVKSKK